MAISTNIIKERVETLAKKSQNGYASGFDFNSDLRDANLTLFEYYVKIFEDTERILDALLPFIKEVQIPLTQGTFSATGSFPSDYAHRIEIGVVSTINNPANTCDPNDPVLAPVSSAYPCDYMTTNEERWTLSSAIRRPSLKKNIYRHTFKNGLIHVYPKEIAAISFKYLSQPVTPLWASVFQSTANGDFEAYLNPPASIDCGFPPQELSNMVDLCLFYLGVEVRESALIQFVKMKQTQPLIQ